MYPLQSIISRRLAFFLHRFSALLSCLVLPAGHSWYNELPRAVGYAMLLTRICILLTLIFFPLYGGTSAVWPLAVLAGLTAVGWIGWAADPKRPALQPLPLRWPLALMLIAMVGSSIFSVYRSASTLALLQTLVVIALFALAAMIPWTHNELFTGAAAFGLGLLSGAWYGLWQWVDWYRGTGGFDFRVQSSWENANFYAALLLMSLPLLLVYARHAPKKEYRQGFIIAAVLALLALVLTQSRGGLLAFFLEMLVFAPAWLWAEGKLSARSLRLLAIGFVILVGLVLVSPAGKRVLDPALRAKQFHSQMFRVYTWQGAWRMITHGNPWLGSGPGTFPSVFGEYQVAGYTKHAHHIYLQTLAEMGIPGLLALLWLFGGVLALAIGTLKEAPASDKPPAERIFRMSLSAALLAATIGLMLHGLFDSDWIYPGIQLALLLPAALVWRLDRAPEPTTAAPALARFVVPAVLLLAAVMLGCEARAEYLANEADRQIQLAATLPQQEQVPAIAQAVILYRQALKLAPKNAAYLRRAATVLPPEEATTALKLAMAVEPTNAANWLSYGHLALARGDARTAVTYYASAETKQHNLLPALYGMAQACWQLHEPEETRKAVMRILAVRGTLADKYRPLDVPEPWYVRAWYAEAALAMQRGDDTAAEKAYTQVISAAQEYEHGYTREAEALAARLGTASERVEVQRLAWCAELELARLLAGSDPATAGKYRGEVPSDFSPPVELRRLPFPTLGESAQPE